MADRDVIAIEKGMKEKSMRRIVLAYSGDLDTAIAIPWLTGRHDTEVVTLTLDLGQGDELTDVRERALAAGAARAHVIDAREELVRDYILPAMQAGALYEHRNPLAASLGRAVIAKRLVDIARMEGASTIACGPRVEASVRAIDPALTVVTLREIGGMSHAQKVEYALAHGVRIPMRPDDRCEIRANLWGRSIECSGPDGIGVEAHADVYTLTRAETDCPDEAAYLEVEFDSGIPVRANGIEMPMVELIESLEIIGGAHGVGRIRAARTRAAGTRAAHEAPAAVLLHTAYRQLEKLVIPADLARLKRHLARVYADLVYQGDWFSPTREAIDAFVRTIQPRVTGSVRLKLFKAECRVVRRHLPLPPPDFHSLAAEGLVS